MSDLKKELSEIPPPKPKKVKTVKQKAKRSVNQIIKTSRKKVAAAEQALRSAKQHAENVKNKFKTINKALDVAEVLAAIQEVIDKIEPESIEINEMGSTIN